MDFALSDDQEEIRALAARIFGDLASHDRLRDTEAADERFDRRLWSELASAGLLGLGLPEEHGGAGLGFLETCIVLEEAGKAPAGVFALLGTLVMGAAPLRRFGSDALKRRWLARVAAGEVVLSAALGEAALADGPPGLPVAATKVEGGWMLQGVASNVPAGMLAEAVIVPARISPAGSVGLFVVETDAPGVTRRRQDTTSGYPEALLELDGCFVDAGSLVSDDPAALVWVLERAMAAGCIVQSGCCQAALALTARYTSEREQFGKAIATFQAVGQRAADAYVDTEGVRLTAWQAAWRLAEGLPASEEVAVAKFWADDGAQRVVHAAQHLHGGVGVDRDYPLHRYYLLTKQLAVTLGGATRSLLRLGELMA